MDLIPFTGWSEPYILVCEKAVSRDWIPVAEECRRGHIRLYAPDRNHVDISFEVLPEYDTGVTKKHPGAVVKENDDGNLKRRDFTSALLHTVLLVNRRFCAGINDVSFDGYPRTYMGDQGLLIEFL